MEVDIIAVATIVFWLYLILDLMRDVHLYRPKVSSTPSEAATVCVPR